jgi:hypothetical protein
MKKFIEQSRFNKKTIISEIIDQIRSYKDIQEVN